MPEATLIDVSSMGQQPRNAQSFVLVSHHLCPYVQRAVIVAAEKGIPLKREFIELDRKPQWFVSLSPTGKVPLLKVGNSVLFESAAICEFLDETSPGSLLPEDPIERARHRAWKEFASETLADIAGLYSTTEERIFLDKESALRSRFDVVEDALTAPWFGGRTFGFVDAAWAPVFRYLDAFEKLAGLYLAESCPKVDQWRKALSSRPSVVSAVAADYPERLKSFLLRRQSTLSRLIEQSGHEAET